MTPTMNTASEPTRTSAPVKFRGVPFEYGDMVIIVSPLPLDDVQEFSERIAPTTEEIESSVALLAPMVEGAPAKAARVITDADKARNKERFKIMAEAILKSIRRNHTSGDFSDADFKEFLTMQNVNPAFDAAMGYTSSKFKVRSVGELTDGWATAR